jgi:SAM-dependent methyltransferase
VIEIFAYQGYEIPLDLANLTGGGPDTWDAISHGHMVEYATYCPIQPNHRVLEIGCGVGRDAIHIAELLDDRGEYLGVDIIKPSIEWCQTNITPRHANVTFTHVDIRSRFYNPDGALSVRDVRLPVADHSVDKVILQSVFTHMFEDDIVHYMREFRRVLGEGGRVFASFFILDDESVALAKRTGQPLTFDRPWSRDCRIQDPGNPEGAVGYTPRGLHRMLKRGGLALDQPIHRGLWCGREGVIDGQDIAILRTSDRPPQRRWRLRRPHAA